MKKKWSIVKLAIIGLTIIVGFVLCFVPFRVGSYNFKSFAGSIKLGLDLKGGVYAVYEAQSTEIENFDDAMETTRQSLEETLFSEGYTEATVVIENGDRIRVEVPDAGDGDSSTAILNILGEPAQIEFRLSEDNIVLTGAHIVDAYGGAYDNGYAVYLSLNSEGARRFAEATANNQGSTMSIVKITAAGEEVISSPTINQAITGGQAVITGMASQEEADTLSGQIMSGKFAVQLTQIESSAISATLGQNALNYGLIAGAIGILLIIVFMCCIYGVLGVASSIALLIYTMLMIFLLAVFPWVQLSLPGIAAILLSIGMAIDGNVIICERIKDEYRNGKSILSASHYGFRKSISAIRDGNITTILASIILYIFGTGAVKGFAITLLMGIALALFSSLLVTRGLIKYFVNINQTNPNIYRLKRGKDYVDIRADQNDSATEMEIEREAREKQEKAAARKRTPQGGAI